MRARNSARMNIALFGEWKLYCNFVRETHFALAPHEFVIEREGTRRNSAQMVAADDDGNARAAHERRSPVTFARYFLVQATRAAVESTLVTQCGLLEIVNFYSRAILSLLLPLSPRRRTSAETTEVARGVVATLAVVPTALMRIYSSELITRH